MMGNRLMSRITLRSPTPRSFPLCGWHMAKFHVVVFKSEELEIKPALSASFHAGLILARYFLMSIAPSFISVLH